MRRSASLSACIALVAACGAAAGCGGSPTGGAAGAGGAGPVGGAGSTVVGRSAEERDQLSPLVRRTGAHIEQARLDGQPVLIATPKRAMGGRAVIYVHGASQHGASIVRRGGVVAAALLDAGYVVAGSDARGDAWGNDASVRDYRRLEAVLRRRGVTRFFILAESMGGLAGLELARGAVAFAGIYPVCDLSTMLPTGLGPSIRRAFERAPGAADVRRELAERSPVPPPVPRGRVGTRQRANVAGPPMLFWASPDDQVVPKASNTDRCAADARRAGLDARVIETTGRHGDRSNLDPPRLVAFFDAAGDAADADR